MFVYIAICLSLLFPLYLQRRSERLGLPLEKTPLAICCLILFFLFAMRGEMVGVDTKHYCRVYRQFIDIPLQSVFSAPITVPARAHGRLSLSRAIAFSTSC